MIGDVHKAELEELRFTWNDKIEIFDMNQLEHTREEYRKGYERDFIFTGRNCIGCQYLCKFIVEDCDENFRITLWLTNDVKGLGYLCVTKYEDPWWRLDPIMVCYLLLRIERSLGLKYDWNDIRATGNDFVEYFIRTHSDEIKVIEEDEDEE